MKPIKIFVDCHVFDQSLQGTTSYIKGLYQELIKDKTKIFYFASKNTENLKAFFGEHENVCYLQYKSRSKYIRLLFDIPILIKRNQIDFAHFQYVVPPIKTCKYIVTIHDLLFLDYPKYFPFFYKFSKNIIYRASAKHADVVLTVSEYSKKQIQNHFKISNVTITPNAVDPVFFEEYDKSIVISDVRDKFGFENYFLFVSRWEPRKNHDLLLKVFVENEFYKNYNLVFVGDKAIPNKNYNDYFDTLDNSIKDKIIVLNKINFNDLLLLVRATKLAIYPSIAEGFGIPPLESLAANIPTICSNTTAMSDFDFLKKGLFNPLDEADFKAKLILNLNHTNDDNLRQIIQQKYNWPLSAKLFNEIIKNRSTNS